MTLNESIRAAERRLALRREYEHLATTSIDAHNEWRAARAAQGGGSVTRELRRLAAELRRQADVLDVRADDQSRI